MKRSESALNNGKKIQLDNLWRACEIDKKRIDQISTDEITVFETIEDLCNEPVSVLLLKNASVLHETLGKINQ